MTIGKRVKYIREYKNLSHRQLAEISGVSRSYIIELEKNPSPRTSAAILWKISEALDVPIEDLIKPNGKNTDNF